MKRCLIVLFPLLTAAMLTGCVADIEDQVRVVRVVDGDTIEIEGGERVRYIGIDTPEVYPSEEYYGIEAWEKNRELVGGCLATLERDVSDRDRYGRLLRYVYVDGIFINAELVRLGYARAKSYPPDTRHQELLEQLEEEAKEAHRGLWGAGSSELIITEGIGWKN
ncbi:MAG: thermonuclease family protein [Dehalococcoidia bacterium]|nr:MAG: thermonuclease family protein [Dehalococcoidia bacterium]